MPRTTPTPAEQARQTVSNTIDHEMKKKRIDNKKMADLIGIGYSTFCDRKKHPDKFRLQDIRRMAKVFGCSVSYLLGEQQEQQTTSKVIEQQAEALAGALIDAIRTMAAGQQA